MKKTTKLMGLYKPCLLALVLFVSITSSLAQAQDKSNRFVLTSSFRVGEPMLISNLSLLDEYAPLDRNLGLAFSADVSYKEIADRTSLGLLLDLGYYITQTRRRVNPFGIRNSVLNAYLGALIRHYHIDNAQFQLAGVVSVGYMQTWNVEKREILDRDDSRTKSKGAFAMTLGMEFGIKVSAEKCIGAKVDLSTAVGKSMIEDGDKVRSWLAPSVGIFFRHSL